MNISHTIICCHILWYVIISYVIMDPICFIIWLFHHLYFAFFHHINILSFLVYIVLSYVIIVHHINIFHYIYFIKVVASYLCHHISSFFQCFSAVSCWMPALQRRTTEYTIHQTTRKSLWVGDGTCCNGPDEGKVTIMSLDGFGGTGSDHFITASRHGGNRGPFCILWCSWLVTLR